MLRVSPDRGNQRIEHRGEGGCGHWRVVKVRGSGLEVFITWSPSGVLVALFPRGAGERTGWAGGWEQVGVSEGAAKYFAPRDMTPGYPWEVMTAAGSVDVDVP